jgi:hypothetical protein
MTTEGSVDPMNTGFHRLSRNALALVLLLASLGSASAARGDAGGCELLGFPSEDEGRPAAATPACAVTPVPTQSLLAGVEHVTPAPAPTPRAARRPRARAVMQVPPQPPQPPSDLEHPTRYAMRTDTTIAVRAGSKLMLNNFGGAIAIRTWARNAVRVRAAHGRRDWIEIGSTDKTLHVTSTSRTPGPSRSVAYELTVPPWLPVALSGVYNDVNVEGLKGGIDVETVRGNIVVRQAAGLIALRSVEGVVDLVGAKGVIKVSSVNEAVRIANAIGSIAAEGVNGDIHLIDVDSKDVEATTVNGEVVYDGRIQDGGSYRFATHNGDIALGMSDKANATVGVSTFSGDFESAFAIQPKKAPKGHRFTFALGTGSAKVDLESFQGSIELLRPGGPLLKAKILEAWREHRKGAAKEWKWEIKDAKAPPADEDDEDDQ